MSRPVLCLYCERAKSHKVFFMNSGLWVFTSRETPPNVQYFDGFAATDVAACLNKESDKTVAATAAAPVPDTTVAVAAVPAAPEHAQTASMFAAAGSEKAFLLPVARPGAASCFAVSTQPGILATDMTKGFGGNHPTALLAGAEQGGQVYEFVDVLGRSSGGACLLMRSLIVSSFNS